MIGGTPERIGEVQAFLRGYPEISFLPTTGGFLEVLRRGVDKGMALLQLADALGIRHEDTYAVGDGYNDVEMLQAAAAGFVPANGDERAMGVRRLRGALQRGGRGRARGGDSDGAVPRAPLTCSQSRRHGGRKSRSNLQKCPVRLKQWLARWLCSTLIVVYNDTRNER